MGGRSFPILLKVACGLSLLLLSAAHQKVFTFPAPPPRADSENPDPAQKKKIPLTLQQTLPDAYASRGSEVEAAASQSRDNGRFPPYFPDGVRLAAIPWLAVSDDAAPTSGAGCAQPPNPPVDIPALRGFCVCLPRIGPPGLQAAAWAV